MLALVIAESVAILLLGVLVAGLLRSHAEILRALHSLGADLDPDRDTQPPATHRVAGGQTAADIVGERLDGNAVALSVAGAAHDTALVFLSSTCAGCQPFWTALNAGATAPNEARVVVVVEQEDSRRRLRELAGPIDVIASTDAWRDYDVPGSPHVVLVDGPAGVVVGEGTGSDWEQVCDLLAHAGTGGPSSGAPSSARDNASRIDEELLRSGIDAGHPSLYPADEQPRANEPRADEPRPTGSIGS